MSKKNKAVSIVLSVIIFLFFGFSVTSDNAMNAENGYNETVKFSYTVTPDDEEWSKMSYGEQLRACNMPKELLTICSTEQLAKLTLDYPFVGDVLAYNTAEIAMRCMRGNSNIIGELLSRSNCVEVLLDEYDNLRVDYSMLASPNNSDRSVMKNSGYSKEMFLQTFFASEVDSMDKAQKNRLKNIFGEKYELKKGICDDYATSMLFFDQI